MRDWEKFELKIAEELRKNGIPARRTGNMVRARKCDVETPELLIECVYKKLKGVVSLPKYKMDRTERYAENLGKIPVMVIGLKGSEEKYAILRWKDFISMLKAMKIYNKIKEIIHNLENNKSHI